MSASSPAVRPSPYHYALGAVLAALLGPVVGPFGHHHHDGEGVVRHHHGHGGAHRHDVPVTPPAGEGDEEEAPGAFVATPSSPPVPAAAPAVATPGRRAAERAVAAEDVAVATALDAAVTGPRGPPLSPSV